jgi:hypothetical protein
MLNYRSSTFKKIVGLMFLAVFLFLGVSGYSPQAQALQSPLPTPQPLQRQEVTLRDTTGETARWSQFTSEGFDLRYPSDWQARVLPDQIAGTRIVEFTHSTPDNRVDASIQVWETWLSPGEDWEQEPEVQFYRKQAGQANHVAEPVLVSGQPGWMTQAQPPINSGSLMRAVFVARESRLYRFRLCAYQDKIIAPYLRTFGLLMSTLQTRLDPNRPSTLTPLESAPKALAAGPVSLAAVTANYNRGAAYAYAAAWYNQQNNGDGCYLWYNGSVLDCVFNSGDYGVDGAHFVNRAVWSGGRPIPQLLPSYPLEARTVSALRSWLINDGWIAVAASQAQVGDVVIIGNQCWAGLVVQTGNPPVVAAHSSEWWGSAGSLQCNGNFNKEYLHAPQGGFYSYLPLIMKPPPPPMKDFTGIHLGRRDEQGLSGDWTTAMLQPIDGQNGGTFPRAVVVLSSQVWHIDRPTNNGRCEVAGATPRDDRPVVWDYLTRAAQNGVTILVRIYPSPGNFQEAVLPGWPSSVVTRTLITTTTPAGGNYCGTNLNNFRAIDDVVNEMDAIQAINRINGWPDNSTYFIPANEPNQEWYGGTGVTVPSRSQSAAWAAMDNYFSALIAYARQYHTQTQILTPSMGPAQYAEGIEWGRYANFCQSQLVGGQKGYALMPSTYQQRSNGFYGYSWHNYYTQGREPYETCLDGGFHVSREFPDFMQQAMILHGYPGFIDETDLCSWFSIGGGNCFNTNSLHSKNDDPAATAASLNYFFQAENQSTNAIPALWLLNNYIFNPEYDWHEAFNDSSNSFYNWFNTWWSTAQ